MSRVSPSRPVPGRRSFVALALSVLCAAASTGCATPASVEPAPLADSREKELERTLVGSWNLRFRVPKRGDREPVPRRESWSFSSDNSGEKTIDAEGSDERTTDFEWSLEGRNLTIDDEGGATNYYRVDSWSTQQLRLHVYTSEAVLIFRSADDSGRRRRGPSRQPNPSR